MPSSLESFQSFFRDRSAAARAVDLIKSLNARQDRLIKESTGVDIAPAYWGAPWGPPGADGGTADWMGGYGGSWGLMGWPRDRTQDTEPGPAGMLTEQELRAAVVWSRWLCDRNALAIGFLNHVCNFVLSDGFQWKVVLRGASTGAVATGEADRDGDGEADVDPAVAACQAVLDEFRRRAGWGEAAAGDIDLDGDDPTPPADREHEAFVRLVRDGEVFVRFWVGKDGVAEVRFVEPEQVRAPAGGDDPDCDYEWGIETAGHDSEKRVAYYVVRAGSSNALDLERVPAGRIAHCKANVDATIKRGVPDFFAVFQDLEKVRKLLRNMGEVAAIQAAIAFVTTHPAEVSGLAVQQMIQSGQDWTQYRGPFPGVLGTGGVQTGQVRYADPGKQLDLTNGTAFEAGPTSSAAANFIQVEQAILRAVGIRWGMPEFFSGDASNNNLASSLIAGGPFERAAKRRQKIWAQFEQNVAARVLACAVKAGRLTADRVRRCEVTITCPSVAITDKDKESNARIALVREKLLSPQTAMLQAGEDVNKEIANIKAWAEEFPEGGAQTDPMAAMMGGDPGQGPDGGMPPEAGPPSPVPPPPAGGFDDPPVFESVLSESLIERLGLECYTLEEVVLLSEADRSHLVPVKRVYNGVTRTVYVNPEKGKRDAERKERSDRFKGEHEGRTPKEQLQHNKAQAEPRRQAAREAFAKAQAEPHTITHEQLPALNEHLLTLTRDELREHARKLGEKIGGLKKDVAERLVAKVRAALPGVELKDPDLDMSPAAMDAGKTGSPGTRSREPEDAAKRRADAVVPERGTKEPWEITRDEYAASKNNTDSIRHQWTPTMLEDMSVQQLRNVWSRQDRQSQVSNREPKSKAEWINSILLHQSQQSDEAKRAQQQGGWNVRDRNIDSQSRQIRNRNATLQDAKDHESAVASALAAGKPVPAEVLKDYPTLAAEHPEQSRFTGVAANGVEYRDGVPVKKGEAEAVAATVTVADAVAAHLAETGTEIERAIPANVLAAVRKTHPDAKMAEVGEALQAAYAAKAAAPKPRKLRAGNEDLPDSTRSYTGNPDQLAAVERYQMSAYQDVNKGLWAGKLDPKAARVHAGLQAAMAATPPLDKPVTVHRGPQLTPTDRERVIADLRAAMDAGQLYDHKGYLSTSTGGIKGEVKGGGSGYDRPLQFVIRATHGLDVTPVTDDEHKHEKEFLLPPGKFEVGKIEERGGKTYVHMEQQGFTGVAANGVEYRDGVPVKKQDEPAGEKPSPAVQELVDVALYNSGLVDGDVSGATTADVKRALDKAGNAGTPQRRKADRQIANQYASMWAEAKANPDKYTAADVAAFEREMVAAIPHMEPIDAAGVTVPFRPEDHESAVGIPTGTPVTVTRGGWKVPEGDYTHKALKAVVEPAGEVDGAGAQPQSGAMNDLANKSNAALLAGIRVLEMTPRKRRTPEETARLVELIRERDRRAAAASSSQAQPAQPQPAGSDGVPKAAGKGDPNNPEKTGFTGTAANGVEYVDGVPQKKNEEKPTDGKATAGPDASVDGGRQSVDGRPDRGGVDGGVPEEDTRPRPSRILTDREEFTSPGRVELVPENLRQHLNEAQQQGAAKAIESLDKHGGFLLADGTGVGKTRQLLAVGDRYAKEGKKVVIVAPAEVIKPDWKKGVAGGSYAKDGSVMGVNAKLTKGDSPLAPGSVHITTYNELGKLKGQVDKDTVVLFDESHAMKNSNSQRGKDGREIGFNAGKVMYATATPADKPLHIAHLLRAGVFGGGDTDAKKFFGKSEDTYKKLGLTKQEIYNRYSGQTISKWVVDPKVGSQEVARRINGLFDQMTKEGLMLQRSLSMDNVHTEASHVNLPPEAAAEIQAAYERGKSSGGGEAAAVLAMRRAQEPHKIPAAVEHIKAELAAGRQPIVFLGRVNDNDPAGEGDDEPTIDENTARKLKESLIAAGVPAEHIGELHGAATPTSDAKRRAMDHFNGGKTKVLISTLQSGGTGVNLDDTEGTRPRTVVMMTPPLSANDMVQAAGRVNRLSTKSRAKIISMVSDHPIDQWNMNLLSKKMATLGAVSGKGLEHLTGGEAKEPDAQPYEWGGSLVRQKQLAPATVATAAQPSQAAPAKPASSYKKVATRNGERHLHTFAPSSKFWDLRRANRLPPEVSVGKNQRGDWEANIWGKTPEETDTVREKLKALGINA